MKLRVLWRIISLVLLLGIFLAFLAFVKVYLNNTHNSSVNPVRSINYQEQSFYDQAFENVKDQNVSEEKIGGIIINHHLLASNQIARSLTAAKNSDPQTIILISPNHFSAGYGRFISSVYDWQTPYGLIQTDTKLIKKLQDKDEYFNVDESPFINEHGIYGVLPFIKKVYPDAKIVPIIVKDQASAQEVDQMAEILNQTIPKSSLIIGSFDFSHYLPSQAADFSDIKNLAILDNIDYNSANFMDIDSKTGIRLMMKLLESRDYKQFNLVEHTNSSKITNDYNTPQTTSYINGYWSRGEKIENDKISLMYFGNWTAEGIKKFGIWNSQNYALNNFDRLLAGTDLVIGQGTQAPETNFLGNLNYSGIINPANKLVQKNIRNTEISFLKVANDSDVETLKNLNGRKLAQTDNPALIDKIIAAGAKVIYEESAVQKIEIRNNSAIIYGFGQMEFTNQAQPADDAIVGVETTNNSWILHIMPVHFDKTIQLLSPNQSVNVLARIASASFPELSEQIKTGIINLK